MNVFKLCLDTPFFTSFFTPFFMSCLCSVKTLLCNLICQKHIPHLPSLFYFDSMDFLINFLHEAILADHTIDIVQKRANRVIHIIACPFRIQKNTRCAIVQLQGSILYAQIPKCIDVSSCAKRVKRADENDKGSRLMMSLNI